MKKLIAVLVVLLFSASLAFAADDVIVDVGVHNSNENNNSSDAAANASSNQNQNQGQNQQQGQVMTSPTQLLGLQYGTQFVAPGNGIKSDGWELYYSAVYGHLTVAEVENMRFRQSFWDWSKRTRVVMIGERQEGDPEGISLMRYWPKASANQGDKVIAAVTINGQASWPDEAFIGLAAKQCLEEAGSDRMAILATTNSDGVTSGSSISLGGVASTVYGSGRKGAAVTGGGQLGTIRTTVEERRQFEALCMNKGSVDLYRPAPPVVQAPPPPVVEKKAEMPSPAKVEPPPPQKSCEQTLRERIAELELEVKECKRYCYNNLSLRRDLGETYIALFVCTGEKEHLQTAIHHFAVAERNYKLGHDIASHKGEAAQVIAQVYYNWAGCVRELCGRGAAQVFARAKKLERIPTGFGR